MAQYKNALVSYLDFLGFRRLIGEKTQDEIIEILTLLKETGNFLSYVHDGPKFSGVITSVATFSDYIIRQIEYERIGLDTALGTEMPMLARMQFELLTRMRQPLTNRIDLLTLQFEFKPSREKMSL